MFQYKVIANGFHDSVLYTPTDRRRSVLRVEEKFDKVPSWLEEIKPETKSAAQKRRKAEKKENEADARKTKLDQDAVEAVTFVSSTSDTTETLA